MKALRYIFLILLTILGFCVGLKLEAQVPDTIPQAQVCPPITSQYSAITSNDLVVIQPQNKIFIDLDSPSGGLEYDIYFKAKGKVWKITRVSLSNYVSQYPTKEVKTIP